MSGTAKLADFGLANPIIYTPTSPTGRIENQQHGLTPVYAAPERFSSLPGSNQYQDRISTQADVYSYGLLVYFMYAKKVSTLELVLLTA